MKHGLLRELEIEAGCSRYDFADQEAHSHFICRQCSRIFDLPMPAGFGPGDVDGFIIDSADITYRGLCPECRKAINSKTIKQ